MQTDQYPSDKFDRLRQKADELIRQQSDPEFQPPTDILDLIHELQIYQAELEIQNEELKRAQQELSELHRDFEHLYEFAPCGYLTLNAKGIMTRVNLTGVGLLETTRGSLLQSGFSQFIAPEGRDLFFAACSRAGETEEKQSIQLPLKREKGPLAWVRADIQADRSQSGEVVRWRMVLLDITQKKEAEQALMESEERFRELFENAPVAHQSLDDRGNLIQVNKAWLDMLGYAGHEVLGRNFSEFLLPEKRSQFKRHFPENTSVEQTLGPEFVMCTKSGGQVLVAYQGRVGTDGRGNFKQTHCVLRDITAQRKAEEDKKQLENGLRQAQKMESVGTLAGGIAHEFNNILSIIMGNNELAMDELPEWSHSRHLLGQIRVAVMRARDVVRQLLTFSRRDDDCQTALNVAAVVQESLKLIRSSVTQNIDIQQRIADDIDPVFGNATQINQLIINLCGNAAHAMSRNGGTLTIEMDNVMLDQDSARGYRCLKPGPHVKLVIADTGCGMDAQTLDHIFEPYFTTKEIGIGTGIGLAVVHGIVERHNGAIHVESQPEQGTVFTLLFPAHQGPVESQVKEVVNLPHGTEKVLLVDDEETIVTLGKTMLERQGYRVQGTTDPREALKIVRDDPFSFDLVVTDMAMPHMTGYDLSLKLLNLRPTLPIILCTGYSETITEERAREAGISSFLMKPAGRADFAVTVRKALDEAKGRR